MLIPLKNLTVIHIELAILQSYARFVNILSLHQRLSGWFTDNVLLEIAQETAGEYRQLAFHLDFKAVRVEQIRRNYHTEHIVDITTDILMVSLRSIMHG